MRRWWMVLGAMSVAALLVTLAVVLPSDGDDGIEVTTVDPDAPVDVDVDTDAGIDTGLAAPWDGKDSLGLPVHASPAVDLRDGQSITVSGEGFTPAASLGIVMCSANATGGGGADFCQLGNYTPVNADGNGAFTKSVTVRRVIHTPGDGEVDCGSAPSVCVVAAGNISDYDESGFSPLVFDGTEELPPPPVLDVTPRTGLVEYQVVTIEGSGFAPHSYVWFRQCALRPEGGIDVCDDAISMHDEPGADGQGALRRTTTVVRMIRGYGGQVVDCAESPGRCAILSAGDPENRQAVVPLTFDPSAPLPPPPSFTVSPATGLAEGDLLVVEGRDFRPGAYIDISLCDGAREGSFADREHHDGCTWLAPVGDRHHEGIRAGADGTVEAHLIAVRSIDVWTHQIDCAESPGRCVVVARSAHSVLGDPVPLTFRPE